MGNATWTSAARWRSRIGIALIVLALVIAISVLAWQAWAIVSTSSDPSAPGIARHMPTERSIDTEGGEP